ncbi:hypothetical protein Lal_00027224 [Lupinus albus]|nr:hypothetical protein Lal_00027224 [Lupinus albus]
MVSAGKFRVCFGLLLFARNDLVFKNVVLSITSIQDSTKVKYWLWIKTMAGMETLDYSLWISNPLGSINILIVGSHERELSRLGEKWHSEAVEAVRSSLEREDPRLSKMVRSEFLKWTGFSRLSEKWLA